ncbi:MAG: hypothetical protein MK133_11880, partial [Planctomycetes bacterium]|nr:hypothetical protein [Planctomycetota bacterium]
MNEESRTEPPAKEYAAVRKAALEMLCEAESGGRFVDELLSERIGDFERRDRHLLQEISYGALRHQNTNWPLNSNLVSALAHLDRLDDARSTLDELKNVGRASRL